MRTYEEALAASRDRAAFSNSTEGEGWTATWCDRCIHDRPARRGHEEKGCPLILITLIGRTPSEFLDGPRDEKGRYSIQDQYHCVEFRDENDPGPSGPPRPRPDPPGQLVWLPREGLEGVRMLAQPESAPQHAGALR